MTQCQQHTANSYMSSRRKLDKKTPESSRALEAKLAVLEAKIKNSSHKIFADEKPKANNSNNPALTEREE